MYCKQHDLVGDATMIDMEYIHVDFSELVGQTLTNVVTDDTTIDFYADGGVKYLMYHDQCGGERVWLDDVVGDLADILDSPIVVAEEVWSGNPSPVSEYDDSYTWTFDKIRTINGSISLKWCGSSNGYYSESVDFARVE